jgi:O-methyltransferase involved in polyketide biosynthesis
VRNPRESIFFLSLVVKLDFHHHSDLRLKNSNSSTNKNREGNYQVTPKWARPDRTRCAAWLAIAGWRSQALTFKRTQEE